MHADKIFVLEKGNIIEQGKHQDLVDGKLGSECITKNLPRI